MKSTIESGKRKSAVARATIKKGTGKVKINKLDISVYEPQILRLKLKEPLILAGKVAEKYDISINVIGGGVVGQTNAARLAMARALVKVEPKLKDVFGEYDRQLLIADVRRRESRKPNTHGSARSKRQKSYR